MILQDIQYAGPTSACSQNTSLQNQVRKLALATHQLGQSLTQGIAGNRQDAGPHTSR